MTPPTGVACVTVGADYIGLDGAERLPPDVLPASTSTGRPPRPPRSRRRRPSGDRATTLFLADLLGDVGRRGARAPGSARAAGPATDPATSCSRPRLRLSRPVVRPVVVRLARSGGQGTIEVRKRAASGHFRQVRRVLRPGGRSMDVARRGTRGGVMERSYRGLGLVLLIVLVVAPLTLFAVLALFEDESEDSIRLSLDGVHWKGKVDGALLASPEPWAPGPGAQRHRLRQERRPRPRSTPTSSCRPGRPTPLVRDGYLTLGAERRQGAARCRSRSPTRAQRRPRRRPAQRRLRSPSRSRRPSTTTAPIGATLDSEALRVRLRVERHPHRGGRRAVPPRRHRRPAVAGAGLPGARRGWGAVRAGPRRARGARRALTSDPSPVPTIGRWSLPSSASSRSKATSASTCRRWPRWVSRPSPYAGRPSSPTVDALVLPGGESTTMAKLARTLRAARPAARAGGRRAAGAGHLRRDDPARRPRRGRRRRARRRSAASTSRCGATRSGGRSTRSRRTSTSTASRARCTPCSSAPRGSRRSATDVEVLAPRRGRSGRR